MRLNTLPRVRLANTPTPLQPLPNLTRHLKGPRILVKRDDLTGLAFGGNKARKLEYLMGDALKNNADIIVTGAGFHSNWCTQTAAAARKLGLPVILVKSGPEDGYEPPTWDGNHLLHHLLGADITILKEGSGQRRQEITQELRKQGRNPYTMPVGGSNPIGAAGYVNCMLELLGQSVEQGVKITHLYHATGSGGTQTGLALGAKALNTGIKVVGVTTGFGDVDRTTERLLNLSNETADFLEIDTRITADDINVLTQYGMGYGYATDAKMEAIKLTAETEGLLIDPVYTAPAMAALIDDARNGRLTNDDTAVFLHTGGTAALFPYRDPLMAHTRGEPLPWKIPQWSTDYT
ncbi:MAG: D-cysteine desulfhydrase family protein [Candidatus Bathyarchaeota archaeon]|nr:MAG: D-cysteine desulfhydrase family protein [Candidatus Bathyarchaeota archaeon]